MREGEGVGEGKIQKGRGRKCGGYPCLVCVFVYAFVSYVCNESGRYCASVRIFFFSSFMSFVGHALKTQKRKERGEEEEG